MRWVRETAAVAFLLAATAACSGGTAPRIPPPLTPHTSTRIPVSSGGAFDLVIGQPVRQVTAGDHSYIGVEVTVHAIAGKPIFDLADLRLWPNAAGGSATPRATGAAARACGNEFLVDWMMRVHGAQEMTDALRVPEHTDFFSGCLTFPLATQHTPTQVRYLQQGKVVADWRLRLPAR